MPGTPYCRAAGPSYHITTLKPRRRRPLDTALSPRHVVDSPRMIANVDHFPAEWADALADIEDARREIDDLEGQIAAAEEWLFVERVYGAGVT